MLCVNVRQTCAYNARIKTVSMRPNAKGQQIEVLVEPVKGAPVHSPIIRIIAPIGSSFVNPLIESLLVACGVPVTDEEFDRALDQGTLNGRMIQCVHRSENDPRHPWTITTFAKAA